MSYFKVKRGELSTYLALLYLNLYTYKRPYYKGRLIKNKDIRLIE